METETKQGRYVWVLEEYSIVNSIRLIKQTKG